MRLTTTAISVTAAALAVMPAPSATADPGWGLNGTYTATSNGDWAKRNEVLYQEKSVRSTWTINTTCSYPTECVGTINSDWGWSAPIYMKSGLWYVKKTVDNWQPCPDGTAGPGLQIFRFYPASPNGDSVDAKSQTLLGEDSTTGVSGTCGSSKVVFVTMPFKLVKIA